MNRAELRKKKLDSDCLGAKIAAHERGISDNRKLCYGLMDMSTESALPKCLECGAYIENEEKSYETTKSQ